MRPSLPKPTLIFLLVMSTALGLLGRADRAGAVEGDVKCQTRKMATLSKYAACRMKVAEKAVKRGGSVTDFSKCDRTMLKKWEKAEEPGECTTSADRATLQWEAAQFTRRWSDDLAPPTLEGSCGNSFPACGGDCGGGQTCGRRYECGDGSGLRCASDEDCSGGTPCLPASCECVAPELLSMVFVTSSTFDGDLGGLAGADAACQALADAESLGGTYKAWLSDGGSGPDSRFTRKQWPYVNPNGTVIAHNWQDLTDGELENSINIDESGNDVGVAGAWTNTGSDGSPAVVPFTEHCSAWTSSSSRETGIVGACHFTGGPDSLFDWTASGALPCDISQNYVSQLLHLYCFEQ